jgi:hypothetical protein
LNASSASPDADGSREAIEVQVTHRDLGRE